MIKRHVILLVFVIFSVGFVSAAHLVTLTHVGPGEVSLSVSDASSMFAYDINFSMSGGSDGTSVASVSYDGFLGAGTSTGNNVKDNYFYVYESKLDSGQTGIDGSGNLFDLTFSGGLTLTGSTQVSSDGSVEYVSYNQDGSVASVGVSSSGTGTKTVSTISEVDLSIYPEELSFDFIQNIKGQRQINLENGGGKRVTVQIENVGLSKILELPNEVVLEAGENKKVEIVVNPVEKGLSIGNLIFKVFGEKIQEVPVIVNTRSANFLFDSSIALPLNSRKVEPGDTIRAQIILRQVADSVQVDVRATYMIKDFFGVTYFEESETFAVLDEKSFVKEFPTEGLPVGQKYVLGMEIEYPGAFATSSSIFNIGEKKSSEGYNIRYLGIAIGIVSLLILIYFLLKFIGRKMRRSSSF